MQQATNILVPFREYFLWYLLHLILFLLRFLAMTTPPSPYHKSSFCHFPSPPGRKSRLISHIAPLGAFNLTSAAKGVVRPVGP